MNALPGIKTLDEMKPREIVAELDKYIIGQDEAKRTIAVAIRNRTRRKRLPRRSGMRCRRRTSF